MINPTPENTITLKFEYLGEDNPLEPWHLEIYYGKDVTPLRGCKSDRFSEIALYLIKEFRGRHLHETINIRGRPKFYFKTDFRSGDFPNPHRTWIQNRTRAQNQTLATLLMQEENLKGLLKSAKTQINLDPRAPRPLS